MIFDHQSLEGLGGSCLGLVLAIQFLKKNIHISKHTGKKQCFDFFDRITRYIPLGKGPTKDSSQVKKVAAVSGILSSVEGLTSMGLLFGADRAGAV